MYMKKLCVIAAFAVALVLAGCSKTEFTAPSKNTVSVCFAAGSDTKTSLASDNSVVWAVGDQVSVSISGGNKYTFTATSVSGSTAIFTGEVAEADAEAAIECAVYPAQQNFDIWWSHPRSIPIPGVQPFVEGGFAPGVNPSIAWDAANSFIDTLGCVNTMHFKNMAGLLAVDVQSAVPVKSVKVMGNNNETMAGSFDMEAWAMKYETIKSSFVDVTLTDGSNLLDLTTAKQCVFVVKPNDFTAGVTVVCEDENGKKASKSINIPFELGMAKKAVLPAVTFAADDFKTPITESVDLAGTYLIDNGSSCNAFYFSTNKYVMQPEIFSAEGDTKANGRAYRVQYNQYSGMDLYFDLSDTPMPGHDNCYKLINLQDREGQDPIPDKYNYSYYNASNGAVVFDFAICGYWSTEVYCRTYYKVNGSYPGTYNLAGTYNVTLNSTAAFGGTYYKWVSKDPETEDLTAKGYQLNGTYRQMAGDVSLSNGATTAGQEYKVCYSNIWTDGVLFFDILPYEAEGHPGCWTLGNFQDRASAGDKVIGNKSYFDPSTGDLVFDFAIDNNSTVYEMSATLSK